MLYFYLHINNIIGKSLCSEPLMEVPEKLMAQCWVATTWHTPRWKSRIWIGIASFIQRKRFISMGGEGHGPPCIAFLTLSGCSEQKQRMDVEASHCTRTTCTCLSGHKETVTDINAPARFLAYLFSVRAEPYYIIGRTTTSFPNPTNTLVSSSRKTLVTDFLHFGFVDVAESLRNDQGTLRSQGIRRRYCKPRLQLLI